MNQERFESLKSVFTFSLEDKSITLQQFFTNVELSAALGNWTENTKILVAKSKIQGTLIESLQYDNTLATANTWEDFKEALTAIAEPPIDVRTANSELMNCIQAPNERIHQFLPRFQKKVEAYIQAQTTDPINRQNLRITEDEFLMQLFISSLQQPLRQHIALSNTLTYEDAVNLAKTCEPKITSPLNQLGGAQTVFSIQDVNQMVQAAVQQQSQLVKSQQTPQAVPEAVSQQHPSQVPSPASADQVKELTETIKSYAIELVQLKEARKKEQDDKDREQTPRGNFRYYTNRNGYNNRNGYRRQNPFRNPRNYPNPNRNSYFRHNYKQRGYNRNGNRNFRSNWGNKNKSNRNEKHQKSGRKKLIDLICSKILENHAKSVTNSGVDLN